ncbi:glycosyl hydrolase [Methylobacterium komagatae]|uniref:Glycosyl hydrolase n=1 Tax=Methylobacterium komagatae TaxID=374425 RepID=A0ABW2BKJ0_9HYPH
MSRLPMPLLCGAFVLVGSFAGHAQTSTVTTGPNGVSGSTTVTTGPNGKPCKVVHSDDARNTGTMTSSVTAGPGGVSSSTTGGTSVTTRSGNGSTSSSASSPVPAAPP